MNHNKNVVVFTLVTTFLLLVYSVFAAMTHTNYFSLNKVSILSDVFKEPKKPLPLNSAGPALVSGPKTTNAVYTEVAIGGRSLDEYTHGKAITSFYVDTSKSALPALMAKLNALKQGKKQKIRIAWLGDSMIEGDLLTQTFRKRMQQFFGGFGVGFIPATSVTAGFRSTATHKWKGDWKEESFKSTSLTAPLFLSGHTFFTADGELIIKDGTIKDTLQPLLKSLICGYAAGTVAVTVNGQPKQYQAGKLINRLLLDSSTSHTIDITIQNDKLPVYGISMEPQSGVVVDNFSFRGITGLELGKLDTGFLQAVQTESPYDLVVLEYGANLMFRPDEMDYTWYQKHIVQVVKKLRKAMPNTEFLIISTADRAFPYDGTWKTAVGIDNLVKIQAELAYDNNIAFYNMYSNMGGAGTIVSWADTTPSLANKDYIHPNQRGAEILGNMVFDAFMSDMRKVAKK